MDNPSPESPGPETSENGQAKRPKRRVPTNQILPSDRHSFGVHFDVLKRFVTLTGGGRSGIEAERVEGEGIPAQAGSLNVRFLKSIGLLTTTDRGLYVPTPEAVKFVTARSVSDEKARPILRAVLESTWFGSTAKSVLTPTNPVSEDQFLGELAIAAQTDRGKKGSALQTLLEYLVYSGLVLRDERGLVLPSPSAPNTDVGPSMGMPVFPDRGIVEQASAAMATVEKGVSIPWHILQTEDFYVKMRSDENTLDDLIAHLGLLRQKIQRGHSKVEQAGPAISAKPGEP